MILHFPPSYSQLALGGNYVILHIPSDSKGMGIYLQISNHKSWKGRG